MRREQAFFKLRLPRGVAAVRVAEKFHAPVHDQVQVARRRAVRLLFLPAEGLEFVRDGDPFQPDADFTQAVIDQCREGGLLVIKCGVHRNTLRLLAPLNTSLDLAHEALAILRGAIERVRQALTAE